MPTIHLNGTSPQNLADSYLEAARACAAAAEAVQKVEFNMRDYYPVEGSWDKANSERVAHYKALREAEDYHMAIAEHCQQAADEREARRSK